jgi:hypothetical protein
MPGRRHRQFRSGDLSEELGILLLKSIAAVASVPRPEDFGLDAVATLLRSDKMLLYAEETFYVQFKSSTVHEIWYKGHEAAWLKQLELPFFIGNVDRGSATLSLYSTHALTVLLAGENPDSICLKLEAPPENNKDTIATALCVGPAVLKWSMTDAGAPEFANLAYTVLKPILQIEYRNLRYRQAHYAEKIIWKTNESPSAEVAHVFHTHSHTRDRAISVIKSMSPQVIVLAFDCLFRGNRADFETILELIELMRRNGFDPDPSNLTKTMYEQLLPAVEKITSK